MLNVDVLLVSVIRPLLVVAALAGLVDSGLVVAVGTPIAAAATSSITVPGAAITAPPSTAPPSTSPPSTAPGATTTLPGSGPTVAPGPTPTHPPGAGIPSIATGGPPTTAAPAVGQPAAPAVDTAPVLLGVAGDLDQLTAITTYQQDRAALASMQQSVAVAGDQLRNAERALAAVASRHTQARSETSVAAGRLTHLAIAAYTGEAYATPAAGPVVADPSVVDMPFGLKGTAALYANVMMGAVISQVHAALSRSQRSLGDVEHQLATANTVVASAAATLNQATAALGAGQMAVSAAAEAASNQDAARASQTVAAASAAAVTRGHPTTTRPARPGSGGASTPSGAIARARTLVPDVSVLGTPALTADDLTGWFGAAGHAPDITVPIAQLAADYLAAGRQTGVRGDIAFAQSIVETGYFSFPSSGQLGPGDNNFAGIGACDSCTHGFTYPDAATGVAAQMELLEAYASSEKVATPLIGPFGVGGCCSTWMALAGTWATNPSYGVEILSIYKQILDWAIPARLAAVGLGGAVGQAPHLAPLRPGSSIVTAPLPSPHH